MSRTESAAWCTSVCPEWKDDFHSFAIWAKSHGYDENAPRGECTLDRIDPNGNYCPENCRFADMKVQNNNKRGRHLKGELVQDGLGVWHVADALSNG